MDCRSEEIDADRALQRQRGLPEKHGLPAYPRYPIFGQRSRRRRPETQGSAQFEAVKETLTWPEKRRTKSGFRRPTTRWPRRARREPLGKPLHRRLPKVKPRGAYRPKEPHSHKI